MSLRKKIQLTGTDLKWIALVIMILDHVGVALTVSGSGLYWCLRMIGRLAFPLYCFLLVEGFVHTRDVKRYLSRLLLFAVISEIPFDWMNGTLTLDLFSECMAAGKMTLLWEAMALHQNVYFTLALGLIALMGYVSLQRQPVYSIIWCALISGLAWMLRVDYDFAGVALICILYRFRQEPQMRMVWGGGTLIFALGPTEFPALVDFGLMSFYNGKRGNDRGKWLFYGAYPLHLLVLGLLRAL